MTALQFDTDTADLLISGRAPVLADASQFVAELVLRSSRGDFKEFPLLGAEAPLQLAAPLDPFWPGNAKKMLRACGVPVDSVKIDPASGVITIS